MHKKYRPLVVINKKDQVSFKNYTTTLSTVISLTMVISLPARIPKMHNKGVLIKVFVALTKLTAIYTNLLQQRAPTVPNCHKCMIYVIRSQRLQYITIHFSFGKLFIYYIILFAFMSYLWACGYVLE